MNILHICTEYSNKSLYRNLVKSLELYKLRQEVFVPVKKKIDISKFRYDSEYVSFYYPQIVTPFDRINYFKKTKKIKNSIEKYINLKNVDFIHAHTLFTNGGPAYLLYKKYGTPYIVTIRNTDVNLFYKYFVHVRSFAYEVLVNARKIMVLSPNYKQTILEKYIAKENRKFLSEKFMSIPNGIDDFWYKNKPCVKKLNMPNLRLLFVGEFSKNKNIENIINASIILIKKNINVNLTLVGNYGANAKKIRYITAKHKFIKIINKVNSRQELKEIYQANDIFVMPSFRETFGLVYAEALSNGLPVVCSKNQGIDGYFDDGHVGLSVNPKSADDIAKKILDIINSYEIISRNCLISYSQFSWERIAETYYNIYKNVN